MLIILFLITYAEALPQQPEPIKKTLLTSQTSQPDDSLRINKIMQNFADTARSDSLSTISSTYTSKSGIDTTVVYYARDTVSYNVQTRKMRLRGRSSLKFRSQSLDADAIELDFDKSTMDAESGKDSAGKPTGFPKFNDSGEEFVGERIRYNFKSKKGTINLGETQMGEGFYFGNKIKRIDEDDFFVSDGYYTTCNDIDPHYYFGSPEMKVSAKDKVYIDPIIFYVEDLPIFIMPFGLFFPNKSGRQSGLSIPSFFFSKNRGVVFENLGLYLALSDYYDTHFFVDFYTKGGYILKNTTRWNLLNVFNGNFTVQYGKTRVNPDEAYSTAWSLRVNHQQSISPSERADVNLNFSSSDFNRNTSNNLYDRIQQSITSNASYSKNFDNGSNFSISYQREQNIITDEYSQNMPISFNLPNFYPLKFLASKRSSFREFFDKFTLSYRGSLNYSTNSRRQIKTLTLPDSSEKKDTSFIWTERKYISHSPNLSYTLPKIGFFSIRPSLSFGLNNYFRRMTRTYDTVDSTTNDRFENGFFTEYWYSFGVSAQTRVFGLLKPGIFGITALRHTLEPSISYNISPGFSDPGYGFYGSYYDPKQKAAVQYSRFEQEGGSHASSYFSQGLSYSLKNRFEMKLKQGDTVADKNVELMQLDFSGSYRFLDSIKFSNVAVSFRTPSIGILNFNGGANFTLYDEARSWNADSGKYIGRYIPINRFLLESGKGLARLTSISLQLSTQFSSSGAAASTEPETSKAKPAADSATLGDRFRRRHEQQIVEPDYFGDHTPGFSPLSIPWSLSLDLNFSYSQPTVDIITRALSLRANFNMKLTGTWSIDASSEYDFINDELLTPVINIKKDLHCWDLQLRWYPTGYNAGFYLRFGIKSPQLSDLKVEKQSSPLIR